MKVLIVTLLALVAITTGQAWAQTAAVPAPAAVPGRASVAAGNYIIGPEDSLQVVVWKNETLTRVVNVRPDGFISLPLVDDIQASGLTVLQLRDVVAKRLSEFMPTPDVSIIVNDVRSFKVSVMGEIARPGRYELKTWTTVLDVLAQAGGFTQYASRSKIVVLRPNGKKMDRIPFNYNRVIQAGGEDENFYLQPNDIVLVP